MQNVFKKKPQCLTPAKYKVSYFYWSIYRNREKISLAYTLAYLSL